MNSITCCSREELLSKRRKEIFGDCALIEIIHLHDCLRGALKALQIDVNALAEILSSANAEKNSVTDLERRVAGRLKVIWSVFHSHSHAEDEFIWPALKTKTLGKIGGSPKHSPANNNDETNQQECDDRNHCIEQEEYEEDHADEERMFSQMDEFLTKLRDLLTTTLIVNKERPFGMSNQSDVYAMAQELKEMTHKLCHHLMVHLEKEETQCMPLVIQHMSKQEIHELVGQIMGQRSADTIAEIMSMAVQNLDEADREEMVKYMKQSMAGTYFDKWLAMSGWNGSADIQQRQQAASRHTNELTDNSVTGTFDSDDCVVRNNKRPATSNQDKDAFQGECKMSRTTENDLLGSHNAIAQITETSAGFSLGTTSQAELEKLIRAVASNPSLTPKQKNTTIQGLRDSVWKSNQREKQRNMYPPTIVNVSQPSSPNTFSSHLSASTVAVRGPAVSSNCRTRRVTPPSMYFKKNATGKIEVVWTSSHISSKIDIPASSGQNEEIPLFSAAELAPTYHDGAAGAVLGCPHYARACKLRHPKSGRLYTCRLCCEQQREMPTKDQDEPLDRYAVTEVMCMKCNALQPAEDRCINLDCDSHSNPFARYFCRICHLYDDGSRPIFHCPYCNTCRLGLGLGVDFRHCMRCNACVALSDNDHHCIPQKLQGSCPICHETLFQSTEPLRGLKCGHVMHLSCFTEYRRGHAYTCPLCMRSMEDMRDYFALLDTACRMQPMPDAYLSTMSNVYCQDCGKTGRTPYHFVGQKCPHCASYNTRELGRVQNSPED